MMKRGTSGAPGYPPPGSDPYRHLERGFDQLASSYDDDVGGNAIGTRMRSVFRQVLAASFAPGGRLFEIGCGTGAEALWLASRGSEVVATDVSEAMVAQVREKAKAAGLTERIRCRKLAARDIGRLVEEFGEGSFDGGYCHAGALNMEPEIGLVPGSVRTLVKPGGRFVCSVINKASLFEVVFYLGVLRPRKAFRRLGNVVPIPISRKPPLSAYVVPTRFYSPNEIVRLFRDGFSLERLQALQVFLPPANLTDEYAALQPIFLPLERLESRLSTVPPIRSWGHHSILTFRRS